MKTQKIGYIRVSTVDQNTERQLNDIPDLDRVFTDRASGKDTVRPELHAAIQYTREGDVFMVHSMDRLARNVEDILRLVRELNKKGVTVQFMKENITFSGNKEDPQSMLMLTIISAISQFERALIRERQREGIAIAKKKGIYKGRKRALDPIKTEELMKGIGQGTPKTILAKQFGISRETVYQYAKSPSQPNHGNSKNTNGNGNGNCPH